MKAWVLHGIGDIRLEEREIPALRESEVLVEVRCAGICGSDIPRIYETGAHRMPMVPGHEVSGVVQGIGKNVNPYWLGKRVSLFPKIPCGACAMCQKKLYDDCTDYDYVGSRRDGAFAEYMSVPASGLLELTDDISFEEAAMLEPLAVASNAMWMGIGQGGHTLKKEEAVAVCGLGTIGLMLVMLLLEAGYKNIYAIGNKPAQGDRLFAMGLLNDRFCDSHKEDPSTWLSDRTDAGVGVYFECVGKNETVQNGIKAVQPGGKLVLIGNPYGDMHFPRDIYWMILRKQLSVVGVWNSFFRQVLSLRDGKRPDDWHYVMSRITAGRISPSTLISHRFSLTELDRGFALMHDKSCDYTKVMMVR